MHMYLQDNERQNKEEKQGEMKKIMRDRKWETIFSGKPLLSY